MSPIDSFLDLVGKAMQAKDGSQLASLFQVDLFRLSNALASAYNHLNAELTSKFPQDSDNALDMRVKQGLSAVKEDLRSSWEPFTTNIVAYLRFVRDFMQLGDYEKAVKEQQITVQFITVLGDASIGILVLPTVLSLSQFLSRLAIVLDKNPSLARPTSRQVDAQTTEGPQGRITFVEQSANILREAFIKCLSGGLGQSGRTTRPSADDKRVGIYLTANSCLKLLFQCLKLRNAQQLFLSIDAQSPLLSLYPAAQRVTYLYYLGRYHFANSHFYRAQLVLQSAYNQSHRQALKHRRLILIYLIASNVCLGRFPSSTLLMKPEAVEIANYFLPLRKIIVCGDLGEFHSFLELNNRTAQWFLQKRILLQMQNRCEVLVWRSLIRKTFILNGFQGEERKVPYVRLHLVQAAAQWALKRAKPTKVASGAADQPQSLFSFGRPQRAFGSINRSSSNNTPAQSDSSDDDYTCPDFAGLSAAVSETGFDADTGVYHDEQISQDANGDYDEDEEEERRPTLFEIESIVLSLIQQGFLRGFVTHANPRFAIPGAAKGGGALTVGFPPIWEVIRQREGEDDAVVVPGWVRETKTMGGRGGVGAVARAGAGGDGDMGGRVIRLSGARPVGAGPP